MTTIKHFEMEDPFNDNIVKAWIDRRAYHILHITHVNGAHLLQDIPVTPKLRYPMDKNGKFTFPSKIYGIDAYEKLDGTNICQFVYKDAENKSYVSYKTRGMLFVQDTVVPFLSMTIGLLKKYPAIKEMPFKNYMNLSYELYGYLNPITIIYDTPLDIALLFGIKHDHTIVSPAFLNKDDVPTVELKSGIANPNYQGMKDDSWRNTLVPEYNKMRLEMEETLVATKNGGYYKGTEGAIWYTYCLSDDGGLYSVLFKCKPPTIEEIHWGAGGISNNGIKTTIRNALEDMKIATWEHVKDLLLEEFDLFEILLRQTFIERLIKDINAEKVLEMQIVKIYKEHSPGTDRPTVLRWFAKQYPVLNSVKVYNVLSKFGLITQQK